MAIALATLNKAEVKVGLSEPTELNTPAVRAFPTQALDKKMEDLWYSVDTLPDNRKALVHRFISLMHEDRCNVSALSSTLTTWQDEAES